MQELAYTDVFASKGIEYLFVIGCLLALVVFWRMLNRPAREARSVSRRAREAGSALGRWFDVRPDVYYHPGHAWAAPSEGEVLTVGIDDFAHKLIGDPERVRLPRVGARLDQGHPAWSFEIDSRTVDVLSPVDGEVVARNEDLIEHPERAGDDPYGTGWLLKVKPSRPRANLRNLLHGGLVRAWMRDTENRIFHRMSEELGAFVQDGGMPVRGIAKAISHERWEEIVREFLLTD